LPLLPALMPIVSVAQAKSPAGAQGRAHVLRHLRWFQALRGRQKNNTCGTIGAGAGKTLDLRKRTT
jgi:hypothetical protein